MIREIGERNRKYLIKPSDWNFKELVEKRPQNKLKSFKIDLELLQNCKGQSIKKFIKKYPFIKVKYRRKVNEILNLWEELKGEKIESTHISGYTYIILERIVRDEFTVEEIKKAISAIFIPGTFEPEHRSFDIIDDCVITDCLATFYDRMQKVEAINRALKKSQAREEMRILINRIFKGPGKIPYFKYVFGIFEKKYGSLDADTQWFRLHPPQYD